MKRLEKLIKKACISLLAGGLGLGFLSGCGKTLDEALVRELECTVSTVPQMEDIRSGIICYSDTLLLRGNTFAGSFSDLKKSINDKGWTNINHIIAINFANEKLKTDPKNAEVYYLRAKGHFGMGLYEAAIEDLDKSIELAGYSDKIKYLCCKGHVNYRLRKYDSALNDFTNAFNLYKNERCYYGHMDLLLYDLGTVNYQVGKMEESLKYFTAGIPWAGARKVIMYRNRAVVYYAQGNYDAALGDLEIVLKDLQDNYFSELDEEIDKIKRYIACVYTEKKK